MNFLAQWTILRVTLTLNLTGSLIKIHAFCGFHILFSCRSSNLSVSDVNPFITLKIHSLSTEKVVQYPNFRQVCKRFHEELICTVVFVYYHVAILNRIFWKPILCVSQFTSNRIGQNIKGGINSQMI